MKHEKQVEIRWSDVDGFRHVHHAAYVVFFEEARDEWLELMLGAPALLDFVIRRLEIDYLAQARHEDHAVDVTIALDGFGRSSIRTREQLRLAATGAVIATAGCVLVQLDAAGTSSSPLSEDLRRRLAAMQET